MAMVSTTLLSVHLLLENFVLNSIDTVVIDEGKFM